MKHDLELSVGYETELDRPQAQALALELNLPLDNQPLLKLAIEEVRENTKQSDIKTQKLIVSHHRLVLKIDSFSPLFADFSYKTWRKRHDEGRKQGLVRACRPTRGLKIIDATAGWGRDAAILASFGAQVIMLERHPVIAALLANALTHQDERSKQLLHLSLYNVDAVSYLDNLLPEEYPDVIYIDPMHPERQKAALVKKDMQVLQQLVGMDKDAAALIMLAKSRVTKRVVVKWPQSLPPLLKPTASISGKTIRFDIFS